MRAPLLRVALVTEGVQFGGTTTWMLFLSRGLRALGHSVEVFSFRKFHPMHREFSDIGVTVHTMDETQLILEDRLKALYEFLREFQPQVVFSVIGSEALEMQRYVPPSVLRVAMLHDKVLQAFNSVRLHRPWLDELVVVSPPLLQCVTQWVPDLPCTYLEHGIPLRDNMPVRQANPDAPLRILYYGRLDEDPKQVRLFPEIRKKLKERQVSFRWTIHGRGKDEGFLRHEMAEGVKLGDVVFSEPVHHDKLDTIIARHDVYLLASRLEGGPLTLLESMARGLVPVCGDTPCLIQTVVTKDNGFRVDCSNPDAYADSIAALDRDRSLLEAMSMESRRTIVDRFSEMRMTERYLKFLRDRVLNNAPTSWPRLLAIKPMLGTSKPWLQLPALRPIRRWIKRVSGRKSASKTL